MMMKKITEALVSASAPKAATKLVEHSMKDARRMVKRMTRRGMDPRIQFALGAAVAMPLAYLAVRRMRG
jgi:hypothetical protein